MSRLASVASGLVVALALGLSGAVPLSDEMEVPVDRQVPLLARVLSFDRSLAGSSPLVVAVVYQDQNRQSRQTYEAVLRAVASEGLTVQGRPVRVAAVPLTEVGTAAQGLRRARADVAYVAPLRGIDVAALARAASSGGVRTVTGVRRYVEDGVAVGIGLRDGRPEILLHRRAASAAGADFSARLLQLVTLVDA